MSTFPELETWSLEQVSPLVDPVTLDAIVQALQGMSGSTLTTLIGGVAANAVLAFYATRQARARAEKDKHTVDHQLRISLLVQARLAELAHTYGSDRVVVAQFQNGSIYKNGTSVNRLVFTHEYTRAGVSSVSRFQNTLLVSRLPRFMGLLGAGEMVLWDQDTPERDTAMVALMEALGSQRIVYAPIRHPKTEELVGALGLGYVRQIPPEAQAFQALGREASRVGALLLQ